MTPVTDALTRTLSGRYDLLGESVSGGYATVYKARDVRHSRSLAVKVFRSETGDESARARFTREIDIMSVLNHPHILPLIESGDAEEWPYYVTTWVEGGSLRQRLKGVRRLPIEDAVRLAIDVAQTLDYAHRQGVVHRDIKPENILMYRDYAIVADFGIAFNMGAAGGTRLTAEGATIGTPEYMSPEQFSGADTIDGRSDVYALGCVLFEMLVGTPPFTDASSYDILIRHLDEGAPSLTNQNRAIPIALEQAVFTALAKAPANRYETAGDFARALQKLSEPRPAPTAPMPNLGSDVHLLCDRGWQVHEFEKFTRAQLRENPGKPQIIIVHGRQNASHSSFVTRVITECIKPWTNKEHGRERSVVLRRPVEWPREGDVEARVGFLKHMVFRAVDPHFSGDRDCDRFRTLPSLSLIGALVIEHTVQARDWNATSAAAFTKYACEFWGRLVPTARRQGFFIFVKVYHDEPPDAVGVGWLRTRAAQADENRSELASVAAQIANECPCLLLTELPSVKPEDVKLWFETNRIYANAEYRQQELAKEIFGDLPELPMVPIEKKLENIHKIFAAEHSGLAWRSQ